MEPLQEWVCDHCGQIIRCPEDGWFEWLDDDTHRAHSFRIVHHRPASPVSGGCNAYGDHPDRADVHLADHIGQEGLPKLLSFLDVGPMHDPEARHSPRVRDVREIVEVIRRLTIPHYEEARLLWDTAEADGFFDGANEVWIYMPSTLRQLVETYGR